MNLFLLMLIFSRSLVEEMLISLLGEIYTGIEIAYSRASLFAYFLGLSGICRTKYTIYKNSPELLLHWGIKNKQTKNLKALQSLKFNVWGHRTLSWEFLVIAIALILSQAGQGGFPLVCADVSSLCAVSGPTGTGANELRGKDS